MKFLTLIIKDRLLLLAKNGLLPCQADNFDERLLLPAITSVSYTVTMLTVLHNKQSYSSEYDILLERPFDAHAHMSALLVRESSMGMDVEQMGNYMFKSSNKLGYTLFTIAPTKANENLLTNSN